MASWRLTLGGGNNLNFWLGVAPNAVIPILTSKDTAMPCPYKNAVQFSRSL
ncbi:hypothetical protein QUB78_17015 [Microcoleus sp. ARI1-A4]